MVVTADISSPFDSDILQRSSPCPVNHQVVDLVLVSSIEGAPGELADFMVWEELFMLRELFMLPHISFPMAQS